MKIFSSLNTHWFSHFLKKIKPIWNRIKSFNTNPSPTPCAAPAEKKWPPLKEMKLTPIEHEKSSQTPTANTNLLSVTQWPLEASGEAPKSATLVEVEFFPRDPYALQKNSTRDKEKDLNALITHYPSDRLH